MSIDTKELRRELLNGGLTVVQTLGLLDEIDTQAVTITEQAEDIKRNRHISDIAADLILSRDCLQKENARLIAENERLEAENERLNNWEHIMDVLEARHPESVYPTRDDDEGRDLAARLISAIRMFTRKTAASTAELERLNAAIAVKGGNEHAPTQYAYDAACRALERRHAQLAEAQEVAQYMLTNKRGSISMEGDQQWSIRMPREMIDSLRSIAKGGPHE